MGKALRYWPLGLLLAVVVALGCSVYYRAVVTEKPRTDFLMLRDAGRAALDHTDIYEVRRRGWPFYYPPAMAALMAPFAMLPLPAAVLSWYALGMAAVLWSGYRLVQLCDRLTGRLVGPLTVAAFLVNFCAFAAGLQRGQPSPLLFALMVEAFWSYRAGRPARAGMWIALATSLKLYPALLVLPLLVRRDRRGLASFAVFVVLFGLVAPMLVMGPADGWDATHRFCANILAPFFADAAYAQRDVFVQFNQFSPSNQSLFGVLARWLARSSLPEDEPFALSLADLSTTTVRRVALTISLILLLIMIAATLRRPHRESWSEAVVWCLPIVAANFICHVAWHHYYLVLTMPYALAAAALVLLPAGRNRLLLAAVLGLAVACNWLHFAVFFCRQMGLLLLSSLLLWVLLARLAACGLPETVPQDDKAPAE